MLVTRTDWNPLLNKEFKKDYWQDLQRFVHTERQKHQVFPPEEDVFRAFHLTSFTNLKVVILGQDPYHGPGQAHGLCFSVKPPTKPPPSLNNIFKELISDIGTQPAANGSLDSWAAQGVLLLNTTLTVRAHKAASHQKQGWETFTDEVISCINNKQHRVVFILWGASARKKKRLITNTQHFVIESAHPSPLSAHRGFLGSKPFSRTNEALHEVGLGAIDWQLPVQG